MISQGGKICGVINLEGLGTNFIWKIIPPKTKLKTLILNHTQGGLK